tara:strand:- start:266 stop:1057 length:792 start_codon:yes stop_codon:yes gene_type:complete
MKKYLVIGNPIEHSLSPRLHNYWIKENKIDAEYYKKKINEEDIKGIISDIKNGKINGINVTVPFKKSVIPFIDELSAEAKESQSVNTIYLGEGKILGHNTDIAGFELGIRNCKYDLRNKKVLILGAGGVVSSIILGLKKMGASKITISNRTKSKSENLKKYFKYLDIVDWGKITEFDMIINATSLGLNNNDEIKLDYQKVGKNKFFYDIIYNPTETNFLKTAKQFGHKTENGKMMFVYQAHQAFVLWHKIMPKIDNKTIELLN